MDKTKRLFLLVFLITSTSCSIYKSADRNDFETESPAFKIKSLHKTSCSQDTVSGQAQFSRLITVIDDEFIWQHDINQTTYFESTNLKGTYCFYDVTLE